MHLVTGFSLRSGTTDPNAFLASQVPRLKLFVSERNDLPNALQTAIDEFRCDDV
jgi:hypothetical protein